LEYRSLEEIRVIDFHVHLPHRYRDPVMAARFLVGKMDSAGIEKAVVIAIEASPSVLRSHVSPERIRRAAGKVLDYIAHSRNPLVRKLVYNPEEAIREHERILVEHSRSNMEVIAAAREYPERLLPVASYNPEKGVDGLLEEIEPYRDIILGVKIYPTLHCISPDDPALDKLYEAAGKNGWLVIVHTGCDPGLWELPYFCRHARPGKVASAAKKHPDTVFVMAHMGSYSLLMPGIYFSEAVEALQAVENLYADTSAVDPLFIERAVEEVGHEKLLYGSDFPYMLGFDLADHARAIMELDISLEAKRAILRGNALRLLAFLGRGL